MSSGLQFMTKALPILKVALEKRCISVRVTAAATLQEFRASEGFPANA